MLLALCSNTGVGEPIHLKLLSDPHMISTAESLVAKEGENVCMRRTLFNSAKLP